MAPFHSRFVGLAISLFSNARLADALPPGGSGGCFATSCRVVDLCILWLVVSFCRLGGGRF